MAEEQQKFEFIVSAGTEGIDSALSKVKKLEDGIIKAQKAITSVPKTILGPSGSPASLGGDYIQTPYGIKDKSTGKFISKTRAFYMAGAQSNFAEKQSTILGPSGRPARAETQSDLFGGIVRGTAYAPKQSMSLSEAEMDYKTQFDYGLTPKSTVLDRREIDPMAGYTEALAKLQEKYKLGIINHTQYNKSLYKLNDSYKQVTGASDLMSKSTEGLHSRIGKLAVRAVEVIPIWLALRAAYMGIINAVKSVISQYMELDKAMTKVMAVAQYTGDTQKRTYAELEQAVRKYYATSIASFTDIAEAMYQLGSAGRSTQEMLVGFKHIMDLSIGSYTNVSTIARTVSGVMNVFGKELEDVGDKEAQIKYVTDLLADSWRKHQIEVGEISSAFQYLGAVGAATGITFKEFLASVGVSADDMLVGSKNGRLLASAINTMTQNLQELRDLGVVFDPYQPLDYMDVMKQLHAIYEKQGKSLQTNQTFLNVFGAEGARVVLLLMERFEQLTIDVNRTNSSLDVTAKKLKEIREYNIGDLLKELWRLTTTGPSQGSGESWIKKTLQGIVEHWSTARTQGQEVVEIYKKFGNQLELTADQASVLYYALRDLEEFKLAEDLKTKFGIDPNAKIGWSKADYYNLRNQGKILAAEQKKEATKLKEETEKALESTGIKPEEKTDQQNKLNDAKIKELKLLKEISKEEELRLKGYNDEQVAYEKIDDFTKRVNTSLGNSIQHHKLIKAFLEEDIDLLVEMKILPEKIAEGFKLVEEHQKVMLKDLQEYNNVIKSSFKDSFKNMFSGEGDVGDLFSGVQNAMVESYRNTMAEGLSSVFMGSGIGDVFGGAMTKLKEAFGIIGNKIEDKIKISNELLSVIGQNTAALAGVSGAAPTTPGGTATAGPKGVLGIGVSKFSDWFSGVNRVQKNYQPGIGPITEEGRAPAGSMVSDVKALAAAQRRSQNTAGIIGGGIEGVMTGYSAYQSAKAGGATPLKAGMQGAGSVGMGVGAALVTGSYMAGAGTAGYTGAANFWNPVGWILLIVAALMMIGSLFMKDKKAEQESSESRNTEQKVSSKIDITNKQLEIVNRNLVALKNTITTYILPSSAYFAEKMGLDEQFAVNSRRGIL